jgi:hypothetical protein
MQSRVNCRTAVIVSCQIAIALCLAGCSVPFPTYGVSARNVETVRSTPATIKVGPITGAQTSVSCRLQPIGPEGSGTFASYIQEAIADEVVIAGGAPRDRTIQISGTLTNVDVDCGIINGSWTIEMALVVNNGPPVSVKTARNFDGNYFGGVVLQRAYGAFVPTVQQFVADVLNSAAVQAAAKAP